MIRTVKTKLPDNPGKLLDLALDDLAKVKRSKAYEVDMSVWHAPQRDKCSVCLAGAVLAKSCGVPAFEFYSPWHVAIPLAVGQKLEALNAFRVGAVGIGLAVLGLVHQVERGAAVFKTWDRGGAYDPGVPDRQFFRALRRLAKILRKEWKVWKREDRKAAARA